MSKVTIAALLGAFLINGTPAFGAGNCIIYRHAILFNAVSEVRIVVDSGADCRVQFPLDEKTRVDTNEITTHPRHGGVRVHGTSGAYYRSNPGYRGPDKFAFTFCGIDGGKSACADVSVRVTVR